MKKFKWTLALLLFGALLYATEKKQVKKSFDIEPGKLVDIETVSGMDVQVKSWDKPEVYIDLEIKVTCSDDEFESKYVEKFDITGRERISSVFIAFEEEDQDNGWSFWDIFKGKFYYSFTKEITGEIYVPKSNGLKADFRYSDIELNDFSGELNLLGRSNDLYLDNCPNVFSIENDYGKNFISNCGGKLTLDSRSGEIHISEFNGPARISADYARIDIRAVTGNLDISTRSAKVKIEDVDGSLDLKADYSEVTLTKVSGYVNTSNRSGSVTVNDVGGIKVDAPYTKIWIDGVTGKEAKDIQIYDQSGKIQIQNATGRILIDDKYSDITLKNIEGHVIIETQSSKINGEKINGNWKSDSKYSSVRISRLTADEIIIDNQSDVVDIATSKIPSYVNIKNSYGSVDFNMPKGFPGNIFLTALYGDIRSNLPMNTHKEGSTTKAKFENGSGSSKIYIETKSGNIGIKEGI